MNKSVQTLAVEPLLAGRFLLFLLPFFLLGCLRLRLRFLRRRRGLRSRRRRRGLGSRGRRRVLLRTLARRRSLLPRSGLVPIGLRLLGRRTTGFGTIGLGRIRLGTIVRLCRGLAVIARRWRSWTIRHRTSRLGLIVRLIGPVIRGCCRRAVRLGAIARRRLIRLCRRRTVCIRTSARLCCRRPIVARRWSSWTVRFRSIVRLCRRRLLRLRGWWTIRLCGNGRTWTLIRGRLISGTVPRLIGGRRGSGLSRSGSIRLVPGLVARTAHVR